MLMPASIIQLSKDSLKNFEVEKVIRYEFDYEKGEQMALVRFLGMDEEIWVPRSSLDE
jgi:hypothetical protein